MLIMQRVSILLLFILLSVIVIPSYAGRPKKKQIRTIERLIENQNYDKAGEIIGKSLKNYSKHVELNFMMGVCLYHKGSVAESVKYLETALSKVRKRKMIVEVKHYLGKAYHANKMFDKAIDTYQSLNKDISHKNKKLKKEIKRLIESSQYARNMCENPADIKITSLGKTVNTQFAEHSPGISADEKFMVFTSRRGEGGKKDIDGQYFEDIYSAKYNGEKWESPVKIQELATSGHDASVSISPDGRTMLLYRADISSRTAIAGDIYISKRRGDKWSKPQKIKGGINSPYKEGHAAFSKDGNTIYFTSNRPGGKGGMDIYMSKKDKKGNWQRPENLGNVINTEYDELGPFFHPDGKTLYFSSKGHKTIGGFDIFSSEKREGGWTPPENLGYPINSLLDDIYYTPTIDGKRAYFASTRKGGEGNLDIYIMEMKDFSAKKIFVIRGNIGDDLKDQNFDDYRIIVRDKDGKEGVYSPDPISGEYLYIISADKEYDIEYARKGYQTLYTKVMIPFAYYTDKNHGVVSFNRIKLHKEKGGYLRSDLSLDLEKLGLPFTRGELPIVGGQKATLVIRNLGVKKSELNKLADALHHGKVDGVSIDITDKKNIASSDNNIIANPNGKNSGNSIKGITTKNTIDNREYYSVQVKAMRRNLSLEYFTRRGMEVIKIQGKDKLFRYFFGKYHSAKEAGKMLRKIRKSKVKDAFIRKIKGNTIGQIVPKSLWR